MIGRRAFMALNGAIREIRITGELEIVRNWKSLKEKNSSASRKSATAEPDQIF
jgi:hypothetical protein